MRGSQAEDLEAGSELLDITPSPFVVLTLKSKTADAVQSQVVSSTVNPVWNEHFDLLSYREADELTLTGARSLSALPRLI
jgi:Ca2+-dependent lipid-binding protein